MINHESDYSSMLTTEKYSKVPTVDPSTKRKTHTDGQKIANLTQSKYKNDLNDAPTTQSVAGSTLPLVVNTRKKGTLDDGENGYNPFDHRHVEHPTSDVETFVHLLKGSLGSGILAMPIAFANAGLWFGLLATFAVGTICTYCVHILVNCSHILCKRRRIPAMGFADIVEQAFLDGPSTLNRWSRFMRFLVNAFLVLDLLGCCCIYLVFVSTNIKQVVDHYSDSDWNIRVYIALLVIPLIFMCLIRNLKFLTPFSFIANILMFVGIAVTCYYLFSDLPAPENRPGVVTFQKWPVFFGTVIFALEGIGVVMSLENDMKTPEHFIGCPSVLNVGMVIVITLYSIVGFFGYLKYGDSTQGSITLNLPIEEKLAQSVKIMIASAIFLTFTLQFYVPMTIIWKGIEHKIKEEKKNMVEYLIRITLCVLVGAIAIALPNLGPFISLIGAVCLSTLGLMVPAIVELVVYREEPGYGNFNWRLYKNIILMVFGVLGFITGTIVSIKEFADEFGENAS